MPGIGIVTNPYSRRNRLRPRTLDELRGVVSGNGVVAATRDPEDLVRVAREFRSRGIDVLCLNGGDGTNHVTLTAFIREYGDAPLPRIAFLRGGTMNTVARSCGVRRGTPTSLLHRIVRRYARGEPFETTARHALKVDDRYGFIFGNGLIANFLRHYYQGGEPSPAKAVKVLLRAVGAVAVGAPMARDLFRKVEGEVEVDGVSWGDARLFALGAATVTEIGLGFTPFHRALEQAGAFHAVGIGCTPWGIVAALPDIYRGRTPKAEGYRSEVARRLVLRQPKGQAYIVDGDYHVGGEVVTLEAGPRLTLIRA